MVIATKVAVCSSVNVTITTTLQVKVLSDQSRTEIELLLDKHQNLRVRAISGSIGVNKDGQRLGHANSIRNLHQATASEAGSDNRLGCLASDVRSRSIYLGRILSRESTSTVGTPSTIGINDDLTTGQTGITVGSTDDEATRGIQVENGLVIDVLLGDDSLDDMFHEILLDLVVGDIGVVLSGDEDGVHAEGNDGTAFLLVLDGDLGLTVGAEPGAGAVLAHFRETVTQLGGQDVSQRHELGGLVGGIAEHMALVTGTDLLEGLGAHTVDALADIGRLLFEVNENLALIGIKTNVIRDEADVADGVTDNLLVVDLGTGGDLTKDHDHVGLGGGLASNLGFGVLGEASIEDGIRNLIGEFIGVTLVHRLCKMGSYCVMKH